MINLYTIQDINNEIHKILISVFNDTRHCFSWCGLVCNKNGAPQNVTPQLHLFNNLQADSLDIITLVCELEDKWNISISNQELTKLQTFQDIQNLIVSKLKELNLIQSCSNCDTPCAGAPNDNLDPCKSWTLKTI